MTELTECCGRVHLAKIQLTFTPHRPPIPDAMSPFVRRHILPDNGSLSGRSAVVVVGYVRGGIRVSSIEAMRVQVAKVS